MFGNIQTTFGQHSENLRKSSENRLKLRYYGWGSYQEKKTSPSNNITDWHSFLTNRKKTTLVLSTLSAVFLICGVGRAQFLYGGFFFALGRDMVGNHALYGYAFENLSVTEAVHCFRKCRLDCRCISFNYITKETNQSNCQLNEQNKYLKPGALKPKEGSQYYDLVIDYNVVVRRNLLRFFILYNIL